MPDKSDLFEIMRTTRAMRRLKPDPVPDALIRKILQAGVCAPNGGNTQRWRFLVVKDARIKRQVQGYYKRAFDEVIGPRYLKSAPPPGATRAASVRHPSDRLSHGPLRSRRPRPAEGHRVRERVGPPVSRRGGGRMKAWWITPGPGSTAIELRETATPEPKAGELLVRVRATSLNRGELLGGKPGAAAKPGGGECAGEVAKAGDGGTGFAAGDRG